MEYSNHSPTRTLEYSIHPYDHPYDGSSPQSQVNSQTALKLGPPYKKQRIDDNNATDLVHCQSSYQPNPTPLFKKQKNNVTNSIHVQSLNPRAGNNIFYKTRICTKFTSGSCRNGESCTFAHGSNDLRKPPPNWQEIVRENSYEDPGSRRMKICYKFSNGEECPYGNACNFLHERLTTIKTNITRPPPTESTIINGKLVMQQNRITGQVVGNKDFGPASQVNIKTWKTKMCSTWEASGQCPYGERCLFAHGQFELQVPGAHVEADMTNDQSFASKPIPLQHEALSTEFGTVVPEITGVWKTPRKIVGIYADWP